jgi:hypothetical protein
MTGSKPDHYFSHASLLSQASVAEILDSWSDLRCRRWRPVQFSGGTPFRQPCPAYPFASGERHRRSVSARKSPNHYYIRKRISQKLKLQSLYDTLEEECNIQQAWMNSRNLTNIASEIEHRQHHLLASQYCIGKTAFEQQIDGSTCRFCLYTLNYWFSNSFSGSSFFMHARTR